MTVFIRFWWASYSPEEIFDTFAAPQFEVSTDGRTFRPARNSISTVADWMIDNDKQITHTTLNEHRRAGSRWEGLYTLAIGKLTMEEAKWKQNRDGGRNE